MSKRDDLLKKDNSGIEEYPLNEQEQQELASILELMNQARIAQDILYTKLVESVAARYEVKDSDLTINIDQVAKSGVTEAKLLTKKI